MRYYVVIPAHNEEATLGITLQSLLNQTLPADTIIVVDDNSTDGTSSIIDSFSGAHKDLRKIRRVSQAAHVPGGKVVQAFNSGLASLDDDFDFIVKLDADLVLPPDYFKTIADHFTSHPRCGIAGGFAYERSSGDNWELNHPMHSDHVRGGFKAYTKECFKAIGGLKAAIGWDTVDELLARYHEYEVHTIPELKVLHLRPLGTSYRPGSAALQGEAFYRMRYGLVISLLASLKMAWKQKDIRVMVANHKGYWNAVRKKLPRIVTAREGKFIRTYRWKRIIRSLS